MKTIILLLLAALPAHADRTINTIEVNGEAHVRVTSGSISSFQGGAWSVNLLGSGAVTSTATTISGSVTVTPGTGTWPVSGTFFQSIQPVSVLGTTFTAVNPGIIAVNGQSGAIAVTSTNTAVTGTFWQSVQPVSGAFFSGSTFTQTNPGYVYLSGVAGSQPVTSTSIYITGQAGALSVFISSPISTSADGSSFTLTNPGNVRLTQINGAIAVTSTNTAVTGIFWNGSTFTATNPGMVYISGISGALSTISSQTTISMMNGALAVTSTFTVAVPSISSIAVYNVLNGVINTASTATVLNFPTLPPGSGVRVSTGITVQRRLDTGRTIFIATGSVVGIIADTIVSLSPQRGLAGGVAATSIGVTAGKTLRIMGWCLTWRNGTAAAGGATAYMRGMASGATTATSPLISALNASTALATVGSGFTSCAQFPDGIDLSGNMTFGISQSAVGAVAGSCITVSGFEW